MVILIVNATPVLSSLISDLTREEGVIVGNGPAVSVAVAVQLPVLVSLPAVVPVSVTASFLHAARISGTEAEPIKKFFRKFFLVCSMVLFFGECCVGEMLPVTE